MRALLFYLTPRTRSRATFGLPHADSQRTPWRAQAETSILVAHFDEDGDGQISYDEFLMGVRGKLSERCALRAYRAPAMRAASAADGADHGHLCPPPAAA